MLIIYNPDICHEKNLFPIWERLKVMGGYKSTYIAELQKISQALYSGYIQID